MSEGLAARALARNCGAGSVTPRGPGPGDQRHDHRGDAGDGDEGGGIEGQLRVGRRQHGMGVAGRQDQRMAISRGAEQGLAADHAAAAGPVLDDRSGWPSRSPEPLGDQPGEHVGGAARREGHDHPAPAGWAAKHPGPGPGRRGSGPGGRRARRGRRRFAGGWRSWTCGLLSLRRGRTTAGPAVTVPVRPDSVNCRWRVRRRLREGTAQPAEAAGRECGRVGLRAADRRQRVTMSLGVRDEECCGTTGREFSGLGRQDRIRSKIATTSGRRRGFQPFVTQIRNI